MSKLFLLLCVVCLNSCSKYAIEDIKSVNEVESRSAIKLDVDKQTFQKDTDFSVKIDVVNKDPKKQ